VRIEQSNFFLENKNAGEFLTSIILKQKSLEKKSYEKK